MQPLDVVARGDNDPYPGTIWVADWAANKILIFEPFNIEGCTFADDINLDEDEDGFTNADEIDNGSNPCSPSSKPVDFDGVLVNGKFLSDLNDPDDDEDGLVDTEDPFAIDPANGLSTEPNLFYDFFNADPGTGFFGLGFTGLMVNDSIDYLDLFDAGDAGLIAGGTAGLLTIPTTPGDANGNTQENAFQFGVRVDSTDCDFTVRARLRTPIFDYTTGYQPFQQVGMFIGTGDQSNYIKVVVADVEIQALQEIGDSLDFAGGVYLTDSLISDVSTSFVDLYFFVDPQAGTAQPAFQRGPSGNLVFGGVMDMGDELEKVVKSPETAMAIGVISTSIGATSFSPTWDFIEVVPPASNSEASVELSHNAADVNASLSEAGSFQFTNSSPDNQIIEEISLDLSTTILPDIVFDPFGNAGDDEAKDVSIDTGEQETGFQNAVFSGANNGGFDSLDIFFNDFNTGETVSFSVEIDPLSISGSNSPGPGGSGNISGLELAGATVNIVFSDCSQKKGRLFPIEGSANSSELVLSSDPLQAPTIQALGLNDDKVTTDAQQPIQINGPTGATVKLVIMEGAQFLDEGSNANNNFANAILGVQELTFNLGDNGSIDTTITLSRTDENGGFNYITAVIEEEGVIGELSETQLVILSLDPCQGFVAQGGGTVSTIDEATEVFVCDESTFVSFNIDGGTTGNQAFLITNNLDSIIVQVQAASFDFDSLSTGEYRVYGATYIGNIQDVSGQSLFSSVLSDSCFILTENFVSVIKDSVEAGTIEAVGLNDTIIACLLDPGTTINLQNQNVISEGFEYVLIDEEGIITSVLAEGTLAISGLPEGKSEIRGLAFTGTLTIEVGDTLTSLLPSNGCISFSQNTIVIDNSPLVGGSIETESGQTLVVVCEGELDQLVLINSDNVGTDYGFIFTDEDSTISQVSLSNVISGEDLPRGSSIIWGVAFKDELSPVQGESLSQFIQNDNCLALSDNNIILEVDTSATCQTSIWSVVGITDLRLYPVPVDNELIISFESNIPGAKETQIDIYDVEGKLVKAERFVTRALGRNEFILNTQYLNSGFYFVKIQNEDRIAFGKFTKK